MRKILALILIIIVALAYGGCGSKAATSADMAPRASYEAAPSSTPAPNPGVSNTSQQNLPENKKIVRNARLGVEVVDAQATYTVLKNWVSQNGGYEFYSESGKSGDYWTVSAQLKLSPDRLDAFLDYVKIQGDLINCVITSNDITDQYVDTQIRLNSAKNSLDKYYEFLDKAATVEDSLRVQNEIDRLTADIESYEGLLNLWDSQVAESTIDLTLREKQDPVKIKKEVNWNAITFGDMLDLMKNGFIGITNILVSIIQWTLIALVAVLPILAIAAIVFFLVRRIKKRKKPAQAKDKTQI